MSNKKYALVAWTEKGQLRMIPSLINEASLPYRERIARLEKQEFKDLKCGILAQSHAHEAFARFLLSVGRPHEAYIEFENAALVCAQCYDETWLDGDRCSFPVLPLLRRFLSMHRECLDLARNDRYLTLCYEGSLLQRNYDSFLLDDRALQQEISEERDSIRAWRFGK